MSNDPHDPQQPDDDATRMEPGSDTGDETSPPPPGADDATRVEREAESGDATRLERPAPDADATRWEGSAPDTGSAPTSPIQLPQALQDRYRVLSQLGRGAQGTVLRCQDTQGDEVAIKLYASMAQGPGLALLRELVGEERNPHVVQVLDSGSDGVYSWEIQEFCRHGNLTEYVAADTPLAPARVREVLVELVEALDYIHARQIVHRDIKPTNILVRTEEPLQLVLADFGTALTGVGSIVVREMAGTMAYASPESLYAKGGKDNDWWGLGVIIHELLTGRHLFASDDGSLPEAAVIMNLLGEANYDHSVDDERWDLLLRGLLNRDSQNRWRAEQVREWLEGVSPEVVDASTLRRRSTVKAFPFRSETYSDPRELAHDMGEHWTDGLALLRESVSDLRRWLHTTDVGMSSDDLLEEISRKTVSAERGLVQLLMVLDPDQPPTFEGRPVSAQGLTEAIDLATKGDAAARGWISRLREKRILPAVALEAVDGAQLARIDHQLGTLWQHSREPMNRIRVRPGGGPIADEVRNQLEGTLLAAAVSDSFGDELLDKAREFPKSEGDSLTGLGQLLDPGKDRSERVAAAAVALFALPAFQARDKEEREQKEREKREKARQEAERLAGERAEERAQQQQERARRRRAQRSNAKETAFFRLSAVALLGLAIAGLHFLIFHEVGPALMAFLIPGALGVAGAWITDILFPGGRGSRLSTTSALVVLLWFTVHGAVAWQQASDSSFTTWPPTGAGPIALLIGYAGGGGLGRILELFPHGAERATSTNPWLVTLPLLTIPFALVNLISGLGLQIPLDATTSLGNPLGWSYRDGIGADVAFWAAVAAIIAIAIDEFLDHWGPAVHRSVWLAVNAAAVVVWSYGIDAVLGSWGVALGVWLATAIVVSVGYALLQFLSDSP